MNRSEHLTDNQLNAYFGDSTFDREAKHKIGQHLLQCDDCLKRLPQPTPAHFWKALMTDENSEDAVDERESFAVRLRHIIQKLTQPKIFALSAAGLLIVLFFSAFIWLNAAKSSEVEKEVAQNIETKEPQIIFNNAGEEKINLPSVIPTAKSDNSSPSASTRIVPDRDLPTAKEIKPKSNSKTASSNDFSVKKQGNLLQKENIALTRGGATPKCGAPTAINLAVETSGEKVVLKWIKVPNAAKYHLYVSDDEEILIDEYETTEGTSYALTKPIDPAKTYQWKVVITLENGNTVIGDSQKFTVKEIQQNLKKSEKNKKFFVRCTANNQSGR
jgi:HAMP domain-containing protein